ncbi:MAG: hypothetical protein ABI645_05295 [Pseudomonadota bacterium]
MGVSKGRIERVCVPKREGHGTRIRAVGCQQSETTSSADSTPGANNIKVSSLADFRAGQKIVVDSGVNREAAVIATPGTFPRAQEV